MPYAFVDAAFFSPWYLRCRTACSFFAKAWATTGHITKEELISHGCITEEEWEHCELLTDPLSLRKVLGMGNEEERSIEELLEGGKQKKTRVLWLHDTKGPSLEKPMSPSRKPLVQLPCPQ